MNKEDKIAIFGGTGLLGKGIWRRLQVEGIEPDIVSRSNGVDLLEKREVEAYFQHHQPDYVFMVAGRVGGIVGNMNSQADFLNENSQMILYVLDAITRHSPHTKLLYTGSTCVYPRENPQPIDESRFLQGPFEETNKGYALAKTVGIVGCELYRKQYGLKTIVAMPTNLFGPGDNYDLENGHMIPSLIKKFVSAKQGGNTPTVWGSGKPRREALYVDDCADACIFLMRYYEGSDIVNIGTGFDYSIEEFVDTIQKTVGYQGEVKWDTSKPDGVFEKRTSINRLLEIMPEYSPRTFEDGLKEVLRQDFGWDL